MPSSEGKVFSLLRIEKHTHTHIESGFVILIMCEKCLRASKISLNTASFPSPSFQNIGVVVGRDPTSGSHLGEVSGEGF